MKSTSSKVVIQNVEHALQVLCTDARCGKIVSAADLKQISSLCAFNNKRQGFTSKQRSLASQLLNRNLLVLRMLGCDLSALLHNQQLNWSSALLTAVSNTWRISYATDHWRISFPWRADLVIALREWSNSALCSPAPSWDSEIQAWRLPHNWNTQQLIRMLLQQWPQRWQCDFDAQLLQTAVPEIVYSAGWQLHQALPAVQSRWQLLLDHISTAELSAVQQCWLLAQLAVPFHQSVQHWLQQHCSAVQAAWLCGTTELVWHQQLPELQQLLVSTQQPLMWAPVPGHNSKLLLKSLAQQLQQTPTHVQTLQQLQSAAAAELCVSASAQLPGQLMRTAHRLGWCMQPSTLIHSKSRDQLLYNSSHSNCWRWLSRRYLQLMPQEVQLPCSA